MVSESCFFRHPEQFSRLVTHAQTRLVEAPATRVTVWSAGCARGEELYSVGLALAAALGTLAPQRVSLHGTDGEVTVARWLRDWATFDTALVSDRARSLPSEHIDIVLFRNVGIYLTEDALREAYALSRELKPDGLLFIAPTDPPPQDFTLLPATTAIFRKPSAPPRVAPPTIPEIPRCPAFTPTTPLASPRRWRRPRSCIDVGPRELP